LAEVKNGIIEYDLTELQQIILENSTEIFSIIDKDYNMIYVNKTPLFNILGYRVQEMIGKNALEFVHPKDFNYAVKKLKVLIKSGYESVEIRIKHKNGTYIWCEISGKTFIDNKENRGILLTTKDISDKKKIEEDFKETREKYKGLTEITELLPDMIVEIDMDLKLTYANPVAFEKFGYTQEDFNNGLYLPQVIDPKELERAKDNIGNILKGVKTEPHEYLGRKKDGTSIYISMHSRPMKDNGKIVGLRAVIHDVTKQRLAEQKLRGSEERFRTLVETTSDWIWEVDENARYTYVSPKITDLLGYAPEEVLGKTPFDLMEPKNKKQVKETFQSISQAQESFDGLENINLHKEGHQLVLETSGVPVFDDDKSFLGYRGIDRDVTERKRIEKELKESEERYRHLFQEAPYGIWIINPFTRTVIDCNKTFDHFLSIYTHKDFIGKNYQEAIGLFERPTHFVPMFKERFRQLLKTGRIDPIEFNISKADGTNLWLTLESSLFLVGGQTRVQTIIMDITQRKNAELELKANEEKFRHLFENSPYAIYLTDVNGKIIDFNSSTAEMFLKDKDKDVIGKTLLQVMPKLLKVPPELISTYKQRIEDLANGIPTKPLELELEFKNGKKIWIYLISTLLKLEEQNIFQVLIQDITEKKQAELKIKESEEELRNLNRDLEEKVIERTEELRKSEAQYRNMINNLDVGFYKGVAKEGLIMYNRAFLDIFGYGPEDDPLGINASQFFINPDEREIYYNQLMKNGAIQGFTCSLNTFNGKEVIVQLNAHTINTGDEDRIEVEGTFIDITEKFRLEQKLKESENMLKAQNIELKKIDKIKNDFITIAAHELKTPLISIYGYTDYILTKHEKELNQEIKDDLHIVQRNITRLRNYMNQLLDVMKIDEDKLKLNKERINICEIMDNCINELSYQINEKKHQLLRTCENQIMLDIDSERIFQVLSNLLSNAIKFTPENGAIEISGQKGEHEYVFRIRDNGIGLTPSELEKIFNKFEMAKQLDDDTLAKEKGTGLGLYIAKGIIEAHGGRIQASSEGRNKGTTFTFTLTL